MSIRERVAGHGLKWLLIGIGGLILLLLVFQLGVLVGYHKADFSYRWGENYQRNFGGPRNVFFGMMGGSGYYINSHGTAGSVVKVDGNTIVMEGQDNTEKTVTFGSNTIIRRINQTVAAADVQAGDQIVVLGRPTDQGQIAADFIRIFPTPAPSPR